MSSLSKPPPKSRATNDSWLLNRKINTSPASLDDKDTLKKFLTTPPVKKIDLHFPLGLEVTARNLKGVTIKDALDAIYKQYKKKVCLPMSQHPDSKLVTTPAGCSKQFNLTLRMPGTIADIYANLGRR